MFILSYSLLILFLCKDRLVSAYILCIHDIPNSLIFFVFLGYVVHMWGFVRCHKSQKFFQYVYWKYMYKWTCVVQSCVVWGSCSCSQVSYNPCIFHISCNVSSFIYNFIDFGPFLPWIVQLEVGQFCLSFQRAHLSFVFFFFFFSLSIVFLWSYR